MNLRSKRTSATFGLALCVLSSFPQPSWASSYGSACDEYDADIRTAVSRWWDDFPLWKYWRAQLYAESRCNPEAESPVGAKGIAQFMDGTFNTWAARVGADPYTSPHVAKWAIPAGAAYMRQLRKGWNGRGRPVLDQHDLATASYNAGQGSIISAQKQCNDALLWFDIAPCLEHVTGPKNAKETLGYVAKIHSNFKLMEAE